MGQLLRDDDEITNETTMYSYDLAGNIKTKTVYECAIDSAPTNLIKTYVYNYDTSWKDKLVSIDDGTETKTLTYDEIGNLKNDTRNSYTWEEGRQLSSINKVGGGQAISFKYNAEGIRTEKTVNGVSTRYHLVGDQVTYESNGTDNIYYTYDASDNLVSMNLNGTEYYYIRNGQGDIIGLFDNTGTQVVSYTYDAWGKLISIKDQSGTDITNDTTHVGYKNSYRYRGYRYDTETGLYYLQSRYYNPEMGRFINADGIINSGLLSSNLFAYCINNPIAFSDPSGFMPSWLHLVKALDLIDSLISELWLMTKVWSTNRVSLIYTIIGMTLAGQISAATGNILIAIVNIGTAALLIANIPRLYSRYVPNIIYHLKKGVSPWHRD